LGTVPLGDFELLVMLGVLQAGEDAYSVSIRRQIEERSGSSVARGALYVTLDRLTGKGFLRSWMGDPTPQRGGKAKRFYAPTEEGLEAVRTSRALLRDMWDGLDPLLEGA